MVERAESHRLDRVGRAGEGRQDHDRRCVAPRPDPAKHIDSIHAPGHAQVEEHGVDVRAERGKALTAGGGEAGRVPKIGQRLGESVAQRRIVVDDQDGCHGTSISKTAPPAAWTRRTSPR